MAHEPWHLVGYQFSGLDNELRNLTPMTALLNTGICPIRIRQTKPRCFSMRQYLRIGLMLIQMTGLDYKVTPIYEGDELIPRKIELQYAGIKSDGTLMKIHLEQNKRASIKMA